MDEKYCPRKAKPEFMAKADSRQSSIGDNPLSPDSISMYEKSFDEQAPNALPPCRCDDRQMAGEYVPSVERGDQGPLDPIV